MTIKVGDRVLWQKREPGKLYVGLGRCRVTGFGKTEEGLDVVTLSHFMFPGEELVAPLTDVHLVPEPVGTK
jgi:hypothetical protein